MPSIFEHYVAMRNEHIIMSYNGSLNGELIAAILQMADSKLKEQQTNLRRKKNIINILIECLQNIYYHSSSDAATGLPTRECTVMLVQNSGEFNICLGNFMLSKHVDSFKGKLDSINTLNKGDLHALYLETLDSGKISVKGGAGIGMLRILREAGQPMEYDFTRVDDTHSFYGLKIRVALQ
ncbi:MAG: SiaB family protein kinase [Bacteroidota bacterium]